MDKSNKNNNLDKELKFKCDLCGSFEYVSLDDTLSDIKELREGGWAYKGGTNCCPNCADKSVINTTF